MELCWAAFLLFFISECFHSLPWVLLGTLLPCSARFGTSVGSLLGFPQRFWVFLGPSLALSGVSWAALGPLLAYLESLLEALELLLGFPL